MSTFPGLIPPKKKRNPKALQLTAEALAPPPPEDEDAPPVIIASDAPRNGVPLPQHQHLQHPHPAPLPPTSSASSSSSGRTRERTSSSSSSRLNPASSGGAAPPPGSIGRASGISRKKPAGLDISKSITSGTPTRPAPTPGSSTGEGRPRRKDHLNGHSHSSSTSSTSSPRGDREGKPAPRVSYQQKLSDQLASLDLGGGNGKTKTDLRTEDLKVVGELGSGNGGTVAKVLHAPSGLYMARKLVLIDAKPSVRKQILRELQIMHDCSSVYIVSFYGAFMADPHICICMEHMDRGSLDNIYREHGPIDIDIVGKISLAVLEGLTYLYDVHRIIHRDVKPSNILVNSLGDIKLCDFGVSGELINSIANTFVGTSTYMSPERIQGAPYTVKSDVWSLGISLIELALGRFPFSDSDADSDLSEPEDGTLHSPLPTSSLANSHETEPVPLPPRRTRPTHTTPKKDKRKSQGVSLGGGGMTMSILDLLQHIVNEPAPKLGEPYGEESVEGRFVDECLRKDPAERPSPGELLERPWMGVIKGKRIDLKAWAEAL